MLAVLEFQKQLLWEIVVGQFLFAESEHNTREPFPVPLELGISEVEMKVMDP